MKVDRLKNLLETPIVEELYNSRCEEYETEKMKRKEAGQHYIDNITKSFNKILKITKDNEKVSKELESIYKDLLAYSVFWDKEYYKLGIADGIKLNNELDSVATNKKMNFTCSFLDDFTTDFDDFMEDYKVNILYKNERYNEIRKKINSIKNQYTNVLNFLENNQMPEFTDEEKKAILEIIKLEDEQNAIEVKEAFVLGIREKKL